MIATIIALLSLTLLGVPLVLAADRAARGPLLVGLAFLYGSGAMFFILLLLSAAHIGWSLLRVCLTAAVLAAAATLFATWRRSTRATSNFPTPKPHLLDILTFATIAAYASYATLAPLWEWDFWAIWGLKARQFLDAGGIDWRFLESRWNAFAHTDYPLLVPLNFDFLAMAQGGWSDRWLGLLFVAFAIALLLVVRAHAARETTPLLAALLTLSLASLSMSRFIGLAEGALIAFGSAGVLFVRAALRDDAAADWRHAALLLGFAANCKNEGVAMLVAVTIALAVIAPRRAVRLWPAWLLVAPWLLLRATHSLANDITSGSAASRIAVRLPFAPRILAFLAAQLDRPWFWVAVLAGVAIIPAASRRAERFALAVTAIQVAFYLTAYFATPHEIRWHIATSWPRLTAQIAVPIAFAVFIALANTLKFAHAETRPGE